MQKMDYPYEASLSFTFPSINLYRVFKIAVALILDLGFYEPLLHVFLLLVEGVLHLSYYRDHLEFDHYASPLQ